MRVHAQGRDAPPRGGVCSSVCVGLLCLAWHVSCSVWEMQGSRHGRCRVHEGPLSQHEHLH
eukprot:5972838-Lingulodinium_polyedra.AAC.1